MKPSFTLLALLVILSGSSVFGQLTPRRTISGTTERQGRLEEQLINGLKATRVEQQQFLRTIVNLTNQRRLDSRLVNAIYIWSIRRQPLYPFPYFERGIRIEARKRNVILPAVALVNRGGNLENPANLPER